MLVMKLHDKQHSLGSARSAHSRPHRLDHGKKLTVTAANSITTKGDEVGQYNQFWLWRFKHPNSKVQAPEKHQLAV
jgi:hypothetical protein